MRKTVYGIFAAAAVLATVFFFASMKAGDIVKAAVRGYAAKIPGAQIGIDGASISIPPGINVHGVFVSRGGFSASAKRVTLYMDMITLLRTMDPASSISRMTIIDPVVRTGGALPPLPAGAVVSGKRLYMEWKNLRVEAGASVITSQMGRVTLKDGSYSALAEISYDGIPARLTYVYRYPDDKWALKAEVHQLDLRVRIAPVNARIEFKGTGAPGAVSAGDVKFEAASRGFTLTGAGTFDSLVVHNSVAVSAVLSTVSFVTPAAQFAGRGRLSYTNGAFALEELQVSSGTQTLNAKGILTNDKIAFTASIRSLQAGVIAPDFGGTLDASLNVRGTLKRPEGDFSAAFTSVSAPGTGVMLKSGKLNLSYRNGNVAFKATLPGYSLAVVAALPQKGALAKTQGSFELVGNTGLKGIFVLSKEELFIANTRLFTNGAETATLNARIGIMKKSKNPFAADIRIKGYTVAGSKLTGKAGVEGFIDSRKELSVNASLKTKNLAFSGRRIPELTGRFTYADGLARLKFNAGKALPGDVSIRVKDGGLRGRIDIAGIDPSSFFKVPFAGAVSGSVALSGTVASPKALINFSSKRLSLGKSHMAFRTDGVYSAGKLKLDGELTLDTKVKGSFSAVVDSLLNNPGINAAAAFNSADINALNGLLQEHAGFSIPLSGILDVALTLKGEAARPALEFRAQSRSRLSYRGALLPSGWTGFTLAGRVTGNFGVLTIDNGEISSEEQVIKVLKGTTVNLSDKNWIKIDGGLDLSNYGIGPVKMFGSIKAAGQIARDLSHAGTSVTLNNFWINQAGLRETSFDVTYENRAAESLGRIVIKPKPAQKLQPGGQLDITRSGEVIFTNFRIVQPLSGGPRPGFRLNGTLSAKNIDLVAEGAGVDFASLTGLFGLDMPVSGDCDFTAVAKGKLKDPYLSSTLNITGGELYSFPFSNANMQVSYSNKTVSVTGLRVVQTDKSGREEILVITGHAKVPLSGQRNVDVLLNVEKGDLSAFQSIAGFVKSASGKIDAKIKVGGRLDEPIYEGYLIVTNGEIQSTKYFDRIRRFNLGLNLSENKIEIKEFSGKIGEGGFRASGFVKMKGLMELEEYRILFETPDKKGLRINVPELPIPIGGLLRSARLEKIIQNYTFGEPHAKIEFSGGAGPAKLSGYIQLDNTHFSYPPPKGAPSATIFKQSGALADLEIKSGENTWYDSDLISANIIGSMRLTGRLSGPNVNGRIESTRGSINYINKVYEIKDAVFEVINNDCFLQANAETTGVFSMPREASGETARPGAKAESAVTLIIPRSPIGEIVPKFTSKDHPELSSDQILKGTYGLSDTMNISERGTWLRQQLVRLFDSSLASPLAKNLLQKSGLIDSVRVTYDTSYTQEPGETRNEGASVSLAEALSGTRYVLEKYLTGDLLLGYALTLGDMRQRLDLRHEFELAYRWRGNIFVSGTYGLAPQRPESNEWKINFEPRWRFGWPDEGKKKD
jgi:autotransporter translocation and assembly factor TamB